MEKEKHVSDEECFVQLSEHPHYLRIEYQSPLGDPSRVAHCIKHWAALCYDKQCQYLLLVRRANGMIRYSIQNMQDISEAYRKYMKNIVIAYVDPDTNLESVFISSVNRGGGLTMHPFETEQAAIEWIQSLQDSCR